MTDKKAEAIKALIPAVEAYLLSGDTMAQAAKKRVWQPVLTQARAALSPAPEAGEEGALSEAIKFVRQIADGRTFDPPGNAVIALDYLEKHRAALSSPRSAGGEAEPVAWLIEWRAFGEDRSRVQVHLRLEPWLEQRSPKITPLYTSPQPARPTREEVAVPRYVIETARRVINAFAPDERILLDVLATALHPTDPATRSGREGE